MALGTTKTFEAILGQHAAPTLVGIKAASLLSFRKDRYRDFNALLASYQPCFSCKGIATFRVAEGEAFVLLLFYREGALMETMRRAFSVPEARQLLVSLGYRTDDALADLLEHLRLRMRLRKTFPHEIGLFLGYPPEDVVGFIKYNGQNFCYSGYWKVYANEKETRALFEQYSVCTHEFCTRLESGTSFPELVQAS
ncbi:DUF3793 family protein [Mitsuokella sp. oral taxon 131]|uniref:DUF3793 family protein n=1 Tax=Mitsuokella sp. oral taxon 131 TaxID=1321780 RepID=UPI0003ADF509|nr:DUF3793 family protein [Mitsuokella sp. oral taxon 131]ERL04301.1 hypothetical protein HMPREF1985_01530 [Mitsuokella sp. oral taxon 131 str. W9106]